MKPKKTREEAHADHQAMLDEHRETKHYKQEDHKKGLHRLKTPTKSLK